MRNALKNIFTILTTRCDEASRMLSKAQDAPLSRTERWALSMHLLSCRVCRKYKKQLTLLRSILQQLQEPQLYKAIASSLFDEKQVQTLKDRTYQKVKKRLNSL